MARGVAQRSVIGRRSVGPRTVCLRPTALGDVTRIARAEGVERRAVGAATDLRRAIQRALFAWPRPVEPRVGGIGLLRIRAARAFTESAEDVRRARRAAGAAVLGIRVEVDAPISALRVPGRARAADHRLVLAASGAEADAGGVEKRERDERT